MHCAGLLAHASLLTRSVCNRLGNVGCLPQWPWCVFDVNNDRGSARWGVVYSGWFSSGREQTFMPSWCGMAWWMFVADVAGRSRSVQVQLRMGTVSSRETLSTHRGMGEHGNSTCRKTFKECMAWKRSVKAHQWP